MSDKKKKAGDYAVFVLTCAFYLGAFTFVWAARTPGNALGIKQAKAGYLHFLYPAKWNFYTRRTSLDKIYKLYRVKDGKLIYEDNRPLDMRFLFGLKRDCKIQHCETEIIAQDTTAGAKDIQYTVTMPDDGDISKYIRPDTIAYNNTPFRNVFYLKGKYLVTIEEQLTWQQKRSAPYQLKTVTIIPVNIQAK